MRSHKLLAAVAGVILLSTTTAAAQDIETAVSKLSWREIGPTIMGGRVSDLAVVESNPATFSGKKLQQQTAFLIASRVQQPGRLQVDAVVPAHSYAFNMICAGD